MNPRQLLVLCALLGLISGCSDPELDAPEEIADIAIEEEIADIAIEPDPDSVEFEPSDPDVFNRNPSSSAAVAFARLENCELETALEDRIREVARRLDELLITFTERHRDVVRTRRLLEDLEQTALEDCVEELQAAFE